VSDFLQQMARGSRERARLARQACPESTLLEQARSSPRPPRLQLHRDGFDLIAELKLRSPAMGQLHSATEDVGGRVRTYAQAGAAAVSVLTEPSRFDGSMVHLEQAAQALAPLGVPAMRKDFLVEPYQVMEARRAGAGGVLVILRMLSSEDLSALLACARELELFVLLEAFDERDIGRMHELVSGPGPAAGELLAGLNCRDLSTLQVVPGRLTELCSLLPTSLPRVAESGVTSAADAAAVARCGYELALVGSALMQGAAPGELAGAMLREGRAARKARACG
jgi:indole-3-glycerol phosphate synthase